MATIKRLGLSGRTLAKHLIARRRLAIFAGTTQLISAGTLRAADLLTCTIFGHNLSTPVPERTGPGSTVSSGFGGAGYTSAVLSVAHNADGSVTASCHAD